MNIQKRIDEARRVLDELLDEREAMANAFNTEHDKLCSLLPQELVCKVFYHYLPGNPSVDIFDEWWGDRDITSQNRALRNLTRVSRQWRAIAREAPELWSIVAPELTGTSESDYKSDMTRMKARLPLYIYLDLSLRVQYSTIYLADDSSLLDVCCSRLVVLCINTPRYVLHFLSSHWSFLRLQKLVFKSRVAVDYTHPPLIEFPTAPVILKLEIKMRQTNTILFSDWGNLKDIVLHKTSVAYLIHILQNATNLTSCQVQHVEKGEDSVTGTATNSMLRDLDVFNMPAKFWDSVCLPALRHLKFRLSGGFEPNDIALIVTPACRFLLRSKCHLQSLLCNSPISEESLFEILEFAPSLLSLSISQVRITKSFFSRLRLPPVSENDTETRPLLPDLETLECELPSGDRFDWGVLVPFLSSRTSEIDGDGCLRSLQILAPYSKKRKPIQINDDMIRELCKASNSAELYIHGKCGTIFIQKTNSIK